MRTNKFTGLIDVGYGTLIRLLNSGILPTQLDIIWVTHGHFDHIGDLATVAGAREMIGRRDKIELKPLDIYGPAGTLKAFKGGMESVGIPDFGINSVNVFELETDQEYADHGDTIAVKVDHFPGMPSVAYFIGARDSGVVYTGDFGRTKPNLGRLLRLPHEARLMICEDSGNHRGHIGTDTALEIWKQRHDKRLALVHLRPEERIAAELAESTYNGAVFIATDGMQVMV